MLPVTRHPLVLCPWLACSFVRLLVRLFVCVCEGKAQAQCLVLLRRQSLSVEVYALVSGMQSSGAAGWARKGGRS